MAKLVVSLNTDTLAEYPLDGATCTIGRQKDNAICLENLAVSSYHARIVPHPPHAYLLEDLHSTNGTFVNAQRIAQHLLHLGDVILIGVYRLQYVDNDGAGTVTAEPAATCDDEQRDAAQASTTEQLLRIDQTGLPAMPIEDAHLQHVLQCTRKAVQLAGDRQASEAAPAKAMLRVLTGPNQRREIPLDTALTVVGMQAPAVLLITRTAKDFFVANAPNNANGPYGRVNDKALAHNAPHLLKHRDIISLGEIDIEFCHDYGVAL